MKQKVPFALTIFFFAEKNQYVLSQRVKRGSLLSQLRKQNAEADITGREENDGVTL